MPKGPYRRLQRHLTLVSVRPHLAEIGIAMDTQCVRTQALPAIEDRSRHHTLTSRARKQPGTLRGNAAIAVLLFGSED